TRWAHPPRRSVLERDLAENVLTHRHRTCAISTCGEETNTNATHAEVAAQNVARGEVSPGWQVACLIRWLHAASDPARRKFAQVRRVVRRTITVRPFNLHNATLQFCPLIFAEAV